MGWLRDWKAQITADHAVTLVKILEKFVLDFHKHYREEVQWLHDRLIVLEKQNLILKARLDALEGKETEGPSGALLKKETLN